MENRPLRNSLFPSSLVANRQLSPSQIPHLLSSPPPRAISNIGNVNDIGLWYVLASDLVSRNALPPPPLPSSLEPRSTVFHRQARAMIHPAASVYEASASYGAVCQNHGCIIMIPLFDIPSLPPPSLETRYGIFRGESGVDYAYETWLPLWP